MDTVATVSGYLDNLAKSERAQFDHIESTVLALAPQAELVMSYGLPTFKYKGKVIVHFGAFKDHLSLFPGAAPIAEFADKLSDFKIAKGTIQFTPEHTIPDSVLKDIIALCAQRAKRGL